MRSRRGALQVCPFRCISASPRRPALVQRLNGAFSDGLGMRGARGLTEEEGCSSTALLRVTTLVPCRLEAPVLQRVAPELRTAAAGWRRPGRALLCHRCAASFSEGTRNPVEIWFSLYRSHCFLPPPPFVFSFRFVIRGNLKGQWLLLMLLQTAVIPQLPLIE